MSGYYNRNNRGITKKLGPVTAYADAVLAGYTGTREQWAQDMAKLGQNVTQVAQNTKLTTELAEQTRVNTEQVAQDTADVRRLAHETSENATQVASNTAESNRLAAETKQAAAQAKEDAEYAGAAADNFRVDTTLSEEGKAAEAKTTGEKFAQLSEEISAETAARNAAITQERNRAVERENEIEELFTAPTHEAVSKWLDEHPEATTTVQDKSLTAEKFTDDLKLHILNDYVTPQMFGAVGDGVTNDSQALLTCAAYCSENNVMLYVPQGTTLLIPENIIIEKVKQITVKGKIIAPKGIEFRYTSKQTSNVWYFNHVSGELTVSGLKNSIITVVYADALTLFANSEISELTSIAYNQFMLGYVKTLTLHGVNSGWINENFFHGGRIGSLTLNGSYSHNNNHFYDNSFESATIVFNCGRSNYIHNARFEGEPSVTFNEKASNNYVQKAWLGETIIGVHTSLPSWWNDPYGHNYYYVGLIAPIKEYVKEINPISYNFVANNMYPSSGKLHNVKGNSHMVETDFISIEHSISFSLLSDVKFMRVYITPYDENKEHIAEEPTESPFYGNSLTWKDSGYYSPGSVSINGVTFSASRYSLLDSKDTGVRYIKIRVAGYDTADIDFVKVRIAAPWYTHIYPFKPDRLTATEKPTAGEWTDGVMAYNTNAGKTCLGWHYNGGTWIEVGTYTS